MTLSLVLNRQPEVKGKASRRPLLVRSALHDEDILVAHRRLDLDRCLAIGKLAQFDLVGASSEAFADAVCEGGMAQATEDAGTTHLVYCVCCWLVDGVSFVVSRYDLVLASSRRNCRWRRGEMLVRVHASACAICDSFGCRHAESVAVHMLEVNFPYLCNFPQVYLPLNDDRMPRHDSDESRDI
jgi:hypothetical protein